MCGRFVAATPPSVLAERFMVDEIVVDDRPPSWNVAPTMDVYAVARSRQGSRRLGTLRWGLVPSWAADLGIGNRLITARGETVATKPTFRSAFQRRRCLVPATGFYEWSGPPKQRQPHVFTLAGGRPFAFAGLWDEDRVGAERVASAAILTTAANEVCAPVHDRMPVVLSGPEAEAAWLSEDVEPEAAMELLAPLESARVSVAPANPAVNKAGVEGEELLTPPEEPRTQRSDTLF
jgi:putative SOS response-associated peptidase YedK